MKTTLALPDPLHRRAKARAAELGVSLTAFFRRALEEALAKASSKPKRAPLELPVASLGVSIDVSKRSNYLDLLD